MKKLTIIKVVSQDDSTPSTEDLDRWRTIFMNHTMTPEEAVATGEVEIEDISFPEHSITLVKVGGDNYKPTFKDLEAWRDIFEEAQYDPYFKIFTHPDIEIEVIDVGKIVAVE